MPEYFNTDDLLLGTGTSPQRTDLNDSTSGGVFDIFSTNAGLSSMNRAREQLQEELNYLNNIRKMIRDAALEGGASWEDANQAANQAVPITTTEEELDIFKDTTDSDIPKTPKELFQESPIEEKQAQIQSILDESPDATIDDILRVMQNWGISAELFKSATGYYPRDYVAQRDAPPSTEPPFEKPGQGEEQGEDDGQLGDDTSETEVIDDDSRKIDDGDGECQPGYERWNGSCVAVCNAAAGYVRDEDPSSPSYGSCVLMGDGGGEEEGDNGGGDDDTKDNGKTCATGYVYDEALQKCVPIKEEETGDGGDLNAPTETTVTGLPQQPITETGGVGGMFAFAAPSPNRTTSEVLAPDLFKIDANIPLVGRLTQARPMAAPQYLLSGISQRYKV